MKYMSESCEHDCNHCSSNCAERKTKNDFLEKPHDLSRIKKVIGIVSGKGGVGKTLVTSLLASEMRRQGFRIGILDGDITGPSIPKSFGISMKAGSNEMGILPVQSKSGIEIMSINLLLENETDPVVWRGPIIAGTVKQFWTEVIWTDIDYLFIDMPPGTGDVPLTIFQSIPVDGIIVVTSPQELVSMIVSKAVKMAEMMAIPILGLVENMSYYQCPDCGEKHQVFGNSHLEEISAIHHIPILGKLPINPQISEACDEGTIEEIPDPWLAKAVDTLKEMM
jgi:Mrp family chromosome partitioning ATPase